MTLVRYPDWRERLRLADIPHLEAKFEWGVHDCVIRSADSVLAMTGVDLAEGFRGRYHTQDEARRVLREIGYRSAGNYVRDILPQIAPIEAQTGDLAEVDSPRGPALGIVLSSRIAVYAEDGSPSAVPLSLARKAFKIG